MNWEFGFNPAGRIQNLAKKRGAEEKCEKRSFARPERDGARQGREIFQ